MKYTFYTFYTDGTCHLEYCTDYRVPPIRTTKAAGKPVFRCFAADTSHAVAKFRLYDTGLLATERLRRGGAAPSLQVLYGVDDAVDTFQLQQFAESYIRAKFPVETPEYEHEFKHSTALVIDAIYTLGNNRPHKPSTWFKMIAILVDYHIYAPDMFSDKLTKYAKSLTYHRWRLGDMKS